MAKKTTKKTTKKTSLKDAIAKISPTEPPFKTWFPPAPPPVESTVRVSHRAALFMKAVAIIAEALEPYNNDERQDLLRSAQATVFDNPPYEPESKY
jgi:hypothetical protein